MKPFITPIISFGATERAANEMIGVMNGFIPDQSGIEELIEHYFDR